MAYEALSHDSVPAPLPDTVNRMREIEACQTVEWVTEWLPNILDAPDVGKRTDWLRYGRKSDDNHDNQPGFTQIIEQDSKTVESQTWRYLVDEANLTKALAKHMKRPQTP